MSYHHGNEPPLEHRLLSRLRMRDFQLLLVLEEETSLRAAAQRLSLTQPAISKSLQEIEEIFGAALFTRSQRGVTPTLQGRMAIRRAREIMKLLTLAQSEIRSNALGRPTVHLGMPPFVAHGYMPVLMGPLIREMAPGRVILTEGPVHELFDRLIEGKLDALISTYAGVMPDTLAPELTYQLLFDCNYSVIAPLGHPLTRRKAVALKSLVDYPWVMPTKTALLRSSLTAAFQRAGVSPPSPVVESNNPITLLRLVAAGVGISCVPGSTIHEVLTNQVQELVVEPAVPDNPVALIYRTADHSPATLLIREFLPRLNSLIAQNP